MNFPAVFYAESAEESQRRERGHPCSFAAFFVLGSFCALLLLFSVGVPDAISVSASKDGVFLLRQFLFFLFFVFFVASSPLGFLLPPFLFLIRGFSLSLSAAALALCGEALYPRILTLFLYAFFRLGVYFYVTDIASTLSIRLNTFFSRRRLFPLYKRSFTAGLILVAVFLTWQILIPTLI